MGPGGRRAVADSRPLLREARQRDRTHVQVDRLGPGARRRLVAGTVRSLSPARAIAYGGLTVGSLDGLDAILFFGLRKGVGPLRIFKGIAGGLLGRDAALVGGLPTALLGVVVHFTIATTIVAVLYILSRRLPFLTRQPFVWGPLYGIAVYLT